MSPRPPDRPLAEPARRWTRVAARHLARSVPVVAGIAVLATAGAGCGRDGAGPAVPDRLRPGVPAAAPSGELVRVHRSLAAGLVLRTFGTVRHLQTASGRFGSEGRKPSFRVVGDVEAVRRVEAAPGGGLRSVVEGQVVVTRTPDDGPPRERVQPFTLRFDEDPQGGAVHRTIRFEAGDLASDLEALEAFFTDRFTLPESGVRVGQSLAPEPVMFLDDALRRPLFFLFQAQALRGRSAAAPIEGTLVVEARAAAGGADALAVRVALTHAYQGDTAASSRDPANVRVEYRAAVEGVHDVAIDGGWSPSHDLSFRRRVRFVASDFDYVVETESRATLLTRRK